MTETRPPSVLHRLAVVLCVMVVAACDSTATPPPGSGAPPTAASGVSPGPGASPAGDAGGDSSQALIAADLAAGTITLAQSLAYRAWALFWDPRLPERYDGSGSEHEDRGLFDEIGDALPTLSADEQAALVPFLRRPTDPRSAWSSDAVGVTLIESTAPDDRCTLPRQWFAKEWSPDGSADRGFRAYVCAPSASTAEPDLGRVLGIGARLWPRMTAGAPGGMGEPIPDLKAPNHEANGKIDIYLLEPLATCRQRGSACEEIGGDTAAQPSDQPKVCGVDGFPAKACTGYLLLRRDRINDAEFAGDFAHEFFHLLQSSHNGQLPRSWYEEASATWAEWEFVGRDGSATQGERDAVKATLWSRYIAFQEQRRSLLRYDPEGFGPTQGLWQYQTWVWPLFQSVKVGPTAVFGAWQAAEGAKTLSDLDKAIDQQLGFQDNYREFAAWNAQPAGYLYGDSEGLDDIMWQSKTNLGSFPNNAHKLINGPKDLKVGTESVQAEVELLATQYDTFTLRNDAVRQITVDISMLQNAGSADLDVLIQMRPPTDDPEKDVWLRKGGDDGKIVLCRDDPDDDAILLEIVLSNHDFARVGDVVPKDQAVSGTYTIETKDKCDVPDGFEVTFSGSDSRGNTWNGTARFERLKEGDPGPPGCRMGAGRVEYCFKFLNGQASWTHSAVGGESHDCDLTASGPISKATGAYGELTLYVRNDDDESRDNTYGGFLQADSLQASPTCGFARDQVISYFGIGPEYKPITAGYHLGGSWRIEGQYGYQEWHWALEPFFLDDETP